MIAFAIISLMAVQSCSNDNENNTARVQVKLIDVPGDYLEVYVEIVDIQYNSSENEEGWTSFESFSGPITVDLTELIAGNSLLLTDEIIPAGMLKQIRLVLSDNNTLVIEGETEPVHLNTPSAQQSGLKLKLDAELEAGFSYTFILDWDVQKSIVKAGNSGIYNLKPVIRVSTEVNSGSIMGNVTGEVEGDDIEGAVALENIIVAVYMNDVSVAESRTDENGDFLIQGLAEGEYIIKIVQEGYDNYETAAAEAIGVTPGQVSDAGTIVLVVGA